MRRGVHAFSLIALLLAVASVAFGDSTGDGLIHGCITQSQALRIPSSGSCAAGEQSLVWRQDGQPGPTGADGPPGEAGPRGFAGPAGPQGPFIPPSDKSPAIYLKSHTFKSATSDQSAGIAAECDLGDTALSGGFAIVGLAVHNSGRYSDATPQDFTPEMNNGRPTGWALFARRTDGMIHRDPNHPNQLTNAPVGIRIAAFSICARDPFGIPAEPSPPPNPVDQPAPTSPVRQPRVAGPVTIACPTSAVAGQPLTVSGDVTDGAGISVDISYGTAASPALYDVHHVVANATDKFADELSSPAATEAGTWQVTASAGGQSATCSVPVTQSLALSCPAYAQPGTAWGIGGSLTHGAFNEPVRLEYDPPTGSPGTPQVTTVNTDVDGDFSDDSTIAPSTSGSDNEVWTVHATYASSGGAAGPGDTTCSITLIYVPLD